MRKQLKNKNRCCAMCKPHKRNWTGRWKNKDIGLSKAANEEKSLYI